MVGVNEMVTFSGLGHKEAREEIDRMIADGLVFKESFAGMLLYRLSFHGRDIATRKIGIVK